VNELILTILAISWAMPDHFPPWASFHGEVPAFVATVFVLIACWRWNASVVRVPAFLGLILAFIFLAILQWWVGLVHYGGDVLLGAIYSLTFAFAWMWGYQWVNTKQKANLTQLASIFLVLAGLVTAFQVFAQWLQVENVFGGWVLDGLRNGRPRSNVGQPNQAATLLMMGLVGIAVLRYRVRVGSSVMWGTALLLSMAVILTQSRTALLSAVLLSGFFIYFSRPAKDDSFTCKSVMLWLGLLFCTAWFFPILKWDAASGGVVGTDQMVTVGTRPLIWKQLILGLLERPWAGWGWLQVPAAQQAGALVLGGTEQATFAHNAVLDLFLFIGIPAACVVLAIVGVWWWRRAPRILASKEAAGAFLLLVPFLVHCLLEFPHAYAYFLVVAGLLLGGIDAWTEDTNAKVLVIPKLVLAVFIAFWISLLLATGYEYVQAEEDFRINRFENRRMGETPADYTPPKLLLLTQLGDMLKAMRLRAKPGMTAEELGTLINVSKRYSWAPMQFRTALSLGLNDRPAEATQQLRVLKGLFAADIYEEAKENWLRLQKEQYPELGKVELP
jgi:hypothetical protein